MKRKAEEKQREKQRKMKGKDRERWESGEKEKEKKRREKSFMTLGQCVGPSFFGYFCWKHSWVMGAKCVGFRELRYFKWWVMSDEWWKLSEEWWVIKKKKKTKQPLKLLFIRQERQTWLCETEGRLCKIRQKLAID